MSRIAAISLLALVSSTSLAFAQDWKIPSESKFVGTWSFDGSCASGDGMSLEPDGIAGYDEWGTGTWAESADGKRIVILLRTDAYNEGAPYAVILKELRVDFHKAQRLEGVFLDENRKIEAVLCPQS